MEEKIKGLISNLTEKTLKKETNWERVGRSEQFNLNLDTGKISIDKLVSSQGKLLYQFSLINLKGDIIFSITGLKKEGITLESSDYDIFKKFHENVSRAYFKVDETIDGLLTEIQKDGEIGKEDDGLPF